MQTNNRDTSITLLIGDFLSLLLVTLIGFATHSSKLDLQRVLATWLPLCLAWSLAAPLLGLWQKKQSPIHKNWWRFLSAVILSVPLGVVLRGLILNTPIMGVFVLVMIGTSALGLLIWRLIWQILLRGK